MNKTKLFVSITKIDMTTGIVSGLVTEEVTDKAKEKMDYASSAPYFKRWSTSFEKATAGKSKGNVRWMHQPVVAGKVLDIRFDDVAKQITVDTKPVDDETLRKIDEGFITGFSLGGNLVGKTWADPDEEGVQRYTVDPVEISYVDNPCLATATIQRIAPDGTAEERVIKHWEPTADEILTTAQAIAAEKGGSYSDHMTTAKADLIAAKTAAPEGLAADDVVAEPEAPPVAEAAVEAPAAEPVVEPTAEKVADFGLDQVWQCRVDGTTHATKAAALAHSDALKTLQDNGSPLAAALEAAKAAGKKPKGDYGDVKYADPGYQTDKKPRYPLDTPAHIRAAWSYINQSKNAALYSDGDLAKVKAAIIAAWKDKINASGPPSAEKMAALDNAQAFELLSKLVASPVRKGMYTVSWVSSLLADMGSLLQGIVWEETMEHDTDSRLPQLAMDAFAALRTLLVEMISEETAELIHDVTQGGEVVDIALLEPGGDAVIIELAARAVEIVKADTALMEKIGARNSKNDAKHIQDAHDSAAKAGASCDPDNCPDAEKVAKAALAENAVLKKSIEDAVPEIAKLGDLVADLTKRLDLTTAELEKVKAQPAPMPVIAPNTRVVGKGESQGGAGADLTSVEAKQVLAELTRHVPPDQLQKMLQDAALGAALANPQPVQMRG